VIFTGRMRIMAVAIVATALGSLSAYQTRRIFEHNYGAWAASLVPLVALVIGLLLVSRPVAVRVVAQALGVIGVTAYAISRQGGTVPGDLGEAFLQGLTSNLSSRWPAPVLPVTVGGVIGALAVAAAISVELALARRFAVAVLLPSVVVMVMVALLAAESGPPSGQVLVAFSVLALLVLRLAALTRSDLPHHARGAKRDVERRSRVSMAIVGTTAVAVGLVPAAFGELLRSNDRFDPRERLADRASAQDEISPLARLDEWRNREPPNEVFSTSTDTPERWRLVALTRYDGRTWVPADDYRLSGGTLRRGTPELDSQLIDVVINDLDARWLPAPDRTLEVSQRVFVDGTYGGLLVDDAPPSGTTYSLLVEPFDVGAPLLAGAGAGTALSVFVEGFALPPEISELASTIVAGATTPYERSLRIASYLQQGYKLVSDVPAGHSLNVLEQFLLVSKTGRDEQFVAAYGVLAAAVGLPVRIAVGFELDPAPGGAAGLVAMSDRVTAWPEVEFDGVGWVRFDTVPARESTESTTGEGTVAPVGQEQDQVPPTTQATPPTSTPPDVSPSVPVTPGFTVPTGVRRAALFSAIALLLVASYVIVVLRLKTMRRLRRRYSPDPERRTTGAFRSGVDVLIDLGATAPTSKTDRELVVAGVGMFGESAKELSPVAERATQAVFDEPEPDEDLATQAWEALGDFEREAAHDLGRWRYLRAKLSLRSFRRGLPD
jgi:transglutaminase-like putative cysteine protease